MMRATCFLLLMALLPRNASAQDTGANNGETKDLKTLDFSVPDVPAVVDLDLSSDKVTRPSTPREFIAALANGFSPDGSFHSGVALEVSPLGLAGIESGPLRALRVSIATVGETKAGVTNGRLAAGLRWAYHAYDPMNDSLLASCLADALPKVELPGRNGEPVELPQPGTHDPSAKEEKSAAAKIDLCRKTFRAAHLAQTALEVAAVADGTSVGTLNLQNLGLPHESFWITGSLGYNSFKAPGDVKNLAEDPALASAYGLQPTLTLRSDVSSLPMSAGTKTDLFTGVRLPAQWDPFDLFVEYGLTLGDLSNTLGMGKLVTHRVGGGGDLRIANGSWVSLYIGQDFGDGATGFSMLGNIKFSTGEKRKYGL